MIRGARIIAACALACALGTGLGSGSARAAQIKVFAAASLTDAMNAALDLWRAQGGDAVGVYAGSSTLARQIEQGAPADLFISANPDWVDYLEARGIASPDDRQTLLGNRLVVIAHVGAAGAAAPPASPAGAAGAIASATGAASATVGATGAAQSTIGATGMAADAAGTTTGATGAPQSTVDAAGVASGVAGSPIGAAEPGGWRTGRGRIATANVEAAPAGIYARQALIALGLWDRLRSRLIEGASVREALMWVARDEAQFGIVYRTDALIEPQVAIIEELPPETHAPILYIATIPVGANADEARRFLAFLSTGPARAVFTQYGFSLPGE